MFDKLEKSMYDPRPEKPDNSPDFPPTPIHMPMVYIKEALRWEYKQMAYDLTEGLPTEDVLNELGQDGWELTGMFAHEEQLHLYFKRVAN